MKILLLLISFFILSSCGGGGVKKSSYYLHKNITSTIFWVGEKGSDENKNIPNLASAWDDIWVYHYGGVDNPDSREGYYPKEFKPFENPFYVALPFNDFNENGEKKANLNFIPWYKETKESLCKNRWVKIIHNGKTAYAQWEDVGPFEEDDKDYVFGTAKPKNQINSSAGIDLSPAVRDYLNLNDIDKVSWQFIDSKDVPNGPWKRITTKSRITWVSWYKPDINTSWEWQLQGDLNLSYQAKLYDIDLFDTTSDTIEKLHNMGKKVICYFSAGSYEEWREDKSKFPKEAIGKELDGWAGENWLDIRNKKVWQIMEDRIKLAKTKGCDGVEPDNVDGYSNDTGFDLKPKDQIRYNKFLSIKAKEQGLAIALKNDLEQIDTLEMFFDFALNEQCHEYDECELLSPFIQNKKPVFNAEYNEKYINDTSEREKLCQDAKRRGFKTLILPLDLDGSFRYSCD